ncbi:MAG: hypothetical protein IJ088_00335, partial [Clostridia bacterium]|nr:hypothetical protein [Clostridia bacterium]
LVFEFPSDIRTGTVHAAEKIVCLCSSGTGRVIACDRTAGPSLEPLLTHLSPRTFGLDTEVVQSREYVSDEEIGEYLRAKRPFIVRIEPDRKWISAEVEKFRGDGCLFGDPFGNGKRITVDHAFPVRRGKDSTIYGGDRIEARLNVFLCTSTSQRGEEDRDFLIRFEQAREDALNGCYLDGETRAFLERYCKMSRDADGTITEVSLTEAGREKRKNHGIMVLVANREDDIETALRKCRLGNEIAEDFEPKSPFEEDCRMPDTGAECPDGELFVRFLAGCMRECLRVRLRRMETFLGITNGNGEHDLQQNLEAETKVKNWLRKQSVSSLLAHFEDLKIETLSNGRLCMPDDSDPTDALFLKAFLGVEESQE